MADLAPDFTTASADIGVNPTIRRPTPAAVGMAVWLGSEVMFFSGLFAAWFTLRSANDPWPPAGIGLEVWRTAIFTVLLVASSGTMILSHRAAERRQMRAAIGWGGLTLALGIAFMANQTVEYLGNGFTMDSGGAYGSIYYLLTGFHGLHVVLGLGLLVFYLTALRTETDTPGFRLATDWYWHFVDVVWVAVFLTVYVIG